MNFIICFSEHDKIELEEKGLRLHKIEELSDGNNKYIFINDMSLKFDAKDNKKFIFSNELNF